MDHDRTSSIPRRGGWGDIAAGVALALVVAVFTVMVLILLRMSLVLIITVTTLVLVASVLAMTIVVRRAAHEPRQQL